MKKRIVWRVLILTLLCVALLAALPVMPQAAEPSLADNTPEEIAIMQAAIVETARSYLRRSEDIRYDWENMTVQSRFVRGITRITSGDGLGSAAPDNLLYTNCAQFTYTSYVETFGYGPNNSTTRTAYVVTYHNTMTADDPEMVLRFGKDGMTDRAAFAKKLKEVLQPGDIVNSLEVSSGTNHSMMYVGDILGDGGHYVIHSSGGPSGHMGDSGVETMRLGTWDIFLGSGNFGIQNTRNDSFTVLRPINVIDFDQLTPTALGRLKYPGLDIVRTADVWHYRDLVPGQEIAVSLRLKNAGSAAFTGITVTDPTPTGARIVANSISHGGSVKNGGAVWTLNLAAGEEVVLTYRVKTTAGIGEEVTLPAGSVAGIPTRTLSWSVGGKQIDPSLTGALVSNRTVQGLSAGTNTMELDFVNTLYRHALGMELGLPSTMQELITGMFDVVRVDKNESSKVSMLQPKAYDKLSARYQAIYDMIIPDHIGGQMVHLGYDPQSMYPRDRVITYFEEGYQPGDVFLMLKGSASTTVKNASDVVTMLYLGDGMVAVPKTDGKGFAVKAFDGAVTDCLNTNVVIGLRPSRCYADAATALAAAPGTVVPPTGAGEPLPFDPTSVAVVVTGDTMVEVATAMELMGSIDESGLSQVRLLNDISCDHVIHLPYSCTIDFDGYTIRTNPTKNNGIEIDDIGSANPVTTFKNGKLVTYTVGARVTKGAIVISNMDLESLSGTCVGIYDPDPAYKDVNLIENSVLTSASWGGVVFNGDGVDCSKTGITIRNTVIVAHKSAGSLVLDYRTTGKPGTITLGTGVELYTKKSTYANSAISLKGLTVSKASGKHTVTAAGRTYSDMYKWTTAATHAVHTWSAWNALPEQHIRVCSLCGLEEKQDHGWKEGACTTCGRKALSASTEKGVITLWTHTLPKDIAVFAVGWENGRMVEVKQAVRGESACVTLPLPAGAEVQLFLLNTALCPVADPITLS